MCDDDDSTDICPYEGHNWRTIQSGGDPAEPSEMTTYCTRCGADQSEAQAEEDHKP